MSIPRDQLKWRTPPSMEMSDGSAASKTAPPSTASNDMSPGERAKNRFAVYGNAIVTGGAGDIGSVVHGLRGLTIFDLHPDAGSKVVDALRADFPDATIIFVEVDVTDPASVTAAVAKSERDVGSVNICLCFAGIAFAAHALDITPHQWATMFNVNTSGAFLCAQAVAKSMKNRESGGSIILMSSISGHIVNFPQPQVHYNAAKCAVLSIKSSLAAEWARYGIRVNSISPGYMDTILNEGDGLAEHRRIWAQRNPYGRMGKPEELTGAVILLASQAGSYMTGTDLLVDGGISIF